MTAPLGLLRSLTRRALDAVLPPRCLACGDVVDAPGALCTACFADFTFIAAPMCRVCGVPLAAAREDLICGGCLQSRPAYNRARAVLVYDDASKGLILKFKHADRTDAAVHLARWMARAGAELIADGDVLVPVPMHRWRLVQRSYNQAALLANALGRLSRKPVVPDALRRVRATASQGRLGRRLRERNVSAAFSCARPAAVTGKRVLLIDDVLTSGATAEACTRSLLAGGARRVDVLVVARVPAPGS